MIRILPYGQVDNSTIFARSVPAFDVTQIVADIITTVRTGGDQALLDYTKRLDHADLTSLQVTEAEFDAAMQAVDPELLSVLETAAANIRKFHEKQVRSGFIINDTPGIVMGQKVIPMDRVGICVPRTPVAFPSTVLMNVIPAKLAGVKEIVLVTPPEEDGSVSPAALAAARIAGATRIFKVGGAQAVAALAYGTESIPKVDKIVGPGGIFVAEAKRQVFGQVAIDMIAGPSEILIVADGGADPRFVAADLLSQAEHDVMASAVLVTDSMPLAQAVQSEVERQLAVLERQETARASVDNNSKIIVVDSLSAAIDIANEIAPEHLELCVDQPFDYLDGIRHAGSIFMGRYCPEALGDYLAGPNHTLPTSGTARFSSPLSVDDFVKKSQYTYYTRHALRNVAQAVSRFAAEEGLGAHAASATIRFEEE